MACVGAAAVCLLNAPFLRMSSSSNSTLLSEALSDTPASAIGSCLLLKVGTRALMNPSNISNICYSMEFSVPCSSQSVVVVEIRPEEMRTSGLGDFKGRVDTEQLFA